MPGTTLDPKADLAQRIAAARERTDRFFALFTPDGLYRRAIPERHRLVFYLGHVEAFAWNLLGRQVLGLSSFDPALDKLFAFGIDPVDSELPADVPVDWPTLDRVRAYGQRIRETLDRAIAYEPVEGD